MSHIPVLLQEVLELLDPRPGDFMIDGTVDGGGHAAAILEKIEPGGKFLGLDLDETMLADCKTRILPGKTSRFLSEIMPTCQKFSQGKNSARQTDFSSISDFLLNRSNIPGGDSVSAMYHAANRSS